MSDFCRHHGFYTPCPSCTGEEVIWEIPIVDCAGGGGADIDSRSRKVDVLRVNAGVYEDAMADIEDYREGAVQTIVRPAPAMERKTERSFPVARDHIPLPVNPGLYARVKTILSSFPTG
jgi:hypothetical protein